MMDREVFRYKGPVRKVSIERIGPSSSDKQLVTELLFSRSGVLEAPIRHDVITSADGRTSITQQIEGCDGFTISEIHDVVLPANGAVFVETIFSPAGVPTQVVLKSRSGEKLSRILFETDERGRVLSVYPESNDAFFKQLPTEIAKAIAEQSPGIEEFRCNFRYDQSGRLIESTMFLLGKHAHHEMRSYNEEGDLVTWTSNGQTISYDYNYDNHGNWICQRPSHPSDVSETHRIITYYE